MGTRSKPHPEGPPLAPSPSPPSGRWRRLRVAARTHRWKTGCGGLLLLGSMALWGADRLLAGPMRSWAETTLNSKLKGYFVKVSRVRPHIWRLGLDLEEVVLVQTLHPDPPVADIGALRFSLQSMELLRLKLAGNLTLERPALHLNLTQIAEQAHRRESLKEQGWQRAVEAIFPFKLDRVMVTDGSLHYLSRQTESKPLHLTQVTMLAQNLRNIAAAKSTYPSPVTLDGLLFDTGRVSFHGAADFLHEPYAAARGEIQVVRVPLDRLTPLAQNFQLKTTGGVLSMEGSVEYTPEIRVAHLTQLLLEDMRVDYVTSTATRAEERVHAQQALKLAKQLRNAPKLKLKIDSLKVNHSQIGFENKSTRPPYRVFISNASLTVANLSNQAHEGPSRFLAKGRFMGSGAVSVSGAAGTASSPADFEVQLKLEDARLLDLNPFLMAHARVDVAAGLFSLYSELKVKDHQVKGYLKPLVKGLKLTSPAKDLRKSFGKRVELHLLQFLAVFLKNRNTQEVATVVRLSGSTSHPNVDGWEALRKLIGNGLFRGILPGFLADPKPAAPPARPAPIRLKANRPGGGRANPGTDAPRSASPNSPP